MTDRRQEPLLSMSAFNGLLALRRYSVAHPGISKESAISALKRVSPDDGYHDYGAALALDEFAGSTDHDDVPVLLRHILTRVIDKTPPWWLRLASFGRDRVRGALSPNEAQCFDAAGLFSAVPTADILHWWDSLAQTARAAEDSNKLRQGRAAEQLTIAYETERLSRLGINRLPRWIALDDNAAGYDVHSFDIGPVEPVAKLIEVKSSARQPQEIFLTRNEWETAIERAPNYRFHIWVMPENQLIELAPSDLERHIPQDAGNGRWQNIRITLC